MDSFKNGHILYLWCNISTYIPFPKYLRVSSISQHEHTHPHITWRYNFAHQVSVSYSLSSRKRTLIGPHDPSSGKFFDHQSWKNDFLLCYFFGRMVLKVVRAANQISNTRRRMEDYTRRIRISRRWFSAERLR